MSENNKENLKNILNNLPKSDKDEDMNEYLKTIDNLTRDDDKEYGFIDKDGNVIRGPITEK